MATVGLLLHHGRAEAVDAAGELTAWLVGAGHEVRLPAADASMAGLEDHGIDEATFGAGLDVAVSLGGDGSMLRAVDLVARDGVAILGVNLGQLGYLTEIEPAGLHEAVGRILAGQHEIEERMLLEVQVVRPGGPPERPRLALNDAVLGKAPTGHTVRIEVAID